MVDHVRGAWQVSIRRACQTVPVDRSTYHYRSKRTGLAPLMNRIKEIAEARVRHGYRRIHVLLRREGWLVNAKRVCRLYCETGLQLRNKPPKWRIKAKLRRDRQGAMQPNEVWAMDFIHDQLFDGAKIRLLTIVDTHTRLAPAIAVRKSYRGSDVVDTLERATQALGYPKTIRLDNGLEFISRELEAPSPTECGKSFIFRLATPARLPSYEAGISQPTWTKVGGKLNHERTLPITGGELGLGSVCFRSASNQTFCARCRHGKNAARYFI